MKALIHLIIFINASLFWGSVFAQEPDNSENPPKIIDTDMSVDKDIVVKKGEKIIFKPGVTIKFDRNVGIVCEGIIEAIGTESKPIIFTAKNSIDGWANVFLKNRTTNGSIFSFCNFSYGKGRFFKFGKNLEIENTVNSTDEDATGCGGALLLYGSGNVKVEDCHFTNNEAGWGGGAISCWGESCPSIMRNYFANNKAGEDGGAIHCVMRSAPFIAANYFEKNTAIYGGAIHCLHFSHPSMTWNYFISNSATKNAGAISCYNECYPTLSSNLLTKNVSPGEGALKAVLNSYPRLLDNCFVDNTSGSQKGKGLPPESIEISSLSEEAILLILKRNRVPNMDLKVK